ncbi:MAG: hypothetical protein COB15_09070 [Flavobacteriales bacterium]|nr:MAG: hypothetical protein COB15_09070 [Flavobacteriales bacterium]
MRTTTFFLLFFLISLLFNSCYNKSVINKKRVVLKACNQPSSIKTWKKYKINKVDSQRYFTYEKNIVYMDYDIEPIFKDTLVKYFADRIELSDMGFSIEILFLIDNKGNVVCTSLLKWCSSDFYCNQINQILSEFNKKFVPAKVREENVWSLFIFELSFWDDEFMKYYDLND